MIPKTGSKWQMSPSRRLAAFFTSCVVSWVLVSGVRAETSAGGWALLQSSAVTPAPQAQTIVVAAPNARVKAIRLVATDGELSLSKLAVNYGNGQSHYEDRGLKLRMGERSREIDPRDEELVLESLSLDVGSVRAGRDDAVTIEIWGQRAPPTVITRGGTDAPSAAERGYYEVPIFFGTTRTKDEEKVKNNRPLVKFGNGRPDSVKLTLGRAVVTVPHDRPPGSIRRPGINLIVAQIILRNEDPARDFTIAEAKELSSSQFVADLKQQAAAAKKFQKQAFVFVHGYNVSFDDAVFRTAQIAQDMGFDGPAVAFSWRSAGGMWDYRHDIDTAKEARDALRELLTLVARDTDIGAVNLVAHSMGNDPVLEVLRENATVKATGGSPPNFKLNEVVLAAPDVARSVFVQFAHVFAGMATGGITLYASSKDRALLASKRVASGIVRAGDVPKEGIVVVRGIESIDITEASTGFFSVNHSTFADRRHLVDDMALLFERTSSKHPPNVRFPIYKMEGQSPAEWWRYRR
jgi:esterase/lipase superfamily enzyme